MDIDPSSRLAEGHKVAGNLLNSLFFFTAGHLLRHYLSNVIYYLSNVIYYLSNVIEVHYLIPALGTRVVQYNRDLLESLLKGLAEWVLGLIPEVHSPAPGPPLRNTPRKRHLG